MEQLPSSLIDLLANNIIIRHTAPYLPVSAILALSGVNKALRQLIQSQPDLWRYLDLTTVKSAIINSAPIDVGGISWRAERIDEALTEDDFYAGPLRGIFGRLHQGKLLQYVQILVLDGLSVPADLVREIVCEDRYNVRILSIRECSNLNQAKLQQCLRYAVRPTRAEGTPKLQALYYFGPRDMPSLNKSTGISTAVEAAPLGGITAVAGATIGAQWNHLSSTTLSSTLSRDDQGRWYGRSGRVLKQPQSGWADTLQMCRGIIAFDAVLCRGTRHDITKVSSTDYLSATIATVALGPGGCEICGTSPEGPARFGGSDASAIPLIAPPPTAATLRAAQRPETINGSAPPVYLRCEDCLRGRWCERCSRWWCERCYENVVSRASADPPMQSSEWTVPGQGQQIKIGVHRDCFDCGRTCAQCSMKYLRICGWCNTPYCHLDDEGSTEKMCSWCSHSGRRTRELY